MWNLSRTCTALGAQRLTTSMHERHMSLATNSSASRRALPNHKKKARLGLGARLTEKVLSDNVLLDAAMRKGFLE